MVKVLDPLGSTEARGRIGGRCHNTWRGISYVKSSTAPSQPRSERQLLVRSRVINLIRKWQTLTSIKQGWWNDYAAAHTESGSMGTTKRLTGANWYVRLNTRLAEMAIAAVDSPPAVAAPNPVTGFVGINGALSFTFDWTAAIAPGTKLDLWSTGPHSAGQLGKIERAKHRTYAEGEAAGPEVVANLAPGTYTLFARLVSETDGLASTWVSDVVTVSAV